MRSLSKDELRALLTSARACRERDWLMILVAFTHGLRATELLSITAKDLKDGYLRALNEKQRKKNKAGQKVLSYKVQPLLENHEVIFSEREPLLIYARKFQPNQKLFDLTRQRFWQIVKQHAKTAGVPAHKAFPHAMRHSCAMELIDAIGIHRTQAWLAQKSMASTGQYLKPSDSEVGEAVRKALGGIVSN